MKSNKGPEQGNQQGCNEFENILKHVRAIKCNHPVPMGEYNEDLSVLS